MRIITYNVNGIRAAIKKGFVDWLKTNPADIVCLQETKALETDVDVSDINRLGYECHFFSAEKKGYSGVAILTKMKPDKVFKGNGIQQSDFEGRVIRADYGDITLINAYFPSGTSGDERQTYKYQWLDEFQDYLLDLRKKRKNLIICGDYNIANKDIDIHNPKGNVKTSGFLPEERAWLDKFWTKGFVDSFRVLNKEPHHYTWWSARFPSVRLENKGWRIDYIAVTEPLESKIKSVAIHPDVKHSDHCPAYLELKLK
jgi:exodeoxyribonuclease-3